MMKFKSLSLIVLLAVVGCSHEDEDATADGTPPPQTFDGTTEDKRFLGEWSNPDGSQKLTVKEDGTASMVGFVNTPKGKQDINEAMQWKADKSKLSFKMKDGGVQRYAFSFSDEGLLLKTAKTSTLYKKAK